MGEVPRQGQEGVEDSINYEKTYINFLADIHVRKCDRLTEVLQRRSHRSGQSNIVLFNVLQGIDMLQTLEIANNDKYYEKNKILGKHPSEAEVVTYFIARGLVHYQATRMIPQRYRNLFHGYNVVYNYNVIRDNHQLGIRIDF